MGINLTYTFRLLIVICLGSICRISSYAQRTDSSLSVSVVMPFCAKQIVDQPNHSNSDLGNACRQYYEGVLLAADSLKRAGYSLSIHSYDTQKDSNLFLKILKRKEVLESDFLIGPVVREAQLSVIPFSKKTQKFHISPLYTFTKTRISDPYLISPNPDLSYYADYLMEYITRNVNAEQVFIVQDPAGSEKVFVQRVQKLTSMYPKVKWVIADVKDPSSIKKQYLSDKPNPVVICSNDENTVNRVLNSVYDTTGVYAIQTFGFMQWMDFNTVNGKLWEQCHVHVLTPLFIQYNQIAVKNFVKSYRETYETDPKSFAFLGYDHFLYFAQMYLQNKDGFKNATQFPRVDLLTNGFKMGYKSDVDGMQNIELNLLRWTDYGFQKIKP